MANKIAILVTIFGIALPLSAFSADDKIPEDYARSKSGACGFLLLKIRQAWDQTNPALTERLARASYFTRNTKPPAINDWTRPHVFGAGRYPTTGLAVLLDRTEDLTFWVTGSGEKATVQVQLVDNYFGKTAAGSYLAKDYGLEFLVNGVDPQSEDLPRLNHLADRALDDLRVARRRKITDLYQRLQVDIGATQVTPSTTFGPEQVPVLTVNFARYTNNVDWTIYIGFLGDRMQFLLEGKNEAGHITRRELSRTYQMFSIWMDGFAVGDAITVATVGLFRYTTKNFMFDKMWEQARPTSDTPLWRQRLSGR